MTDKTGYLRIAALACVIAGSAALPGLADACTRAVYLGPDNMIVTGRTMDWKEDPH